MKEGLKGSDIKYTIGFCLVPEANKVLMLYRSNSPNKNKWNGLGGKINFDAKETPHECIIREVYEETEGLLDLSLAQELRYTGVVTWKGTRADGDYYGGMHVYIASLSGEGMIFDRKETREGILEWLDVNEILSVGANSVVENIPKFLPIMLSSASPAQYHCTYINGELVNFEVVPLSDIIAPWLRP